MRVEGRWKERAGAAGGLRAAVAHWPYKGTANAAGASSAFRSLASVSTRTSRSLLLALTTISSPVLPPSAHSHRNTSTVRSSLVYPPCIFMIFVPASSWVGSDQSSVRACTGFSSAWGLFCSVLPLLEQSH